MKKQIFRFVSGIIPALAIFTTLNAQSENSIAEINGTGIVMTRLSPAEKSITEGGAVSISNRALKDFGKSFKNATNTDWWKIKYGWLARFEAGGVKTRVFYDQYGWWSTTIFTYSIEKLPTDILKQVRSVYYDYEIYLVNEVTNSNGTAYLVSVQNANGYKTIRVTEDSMDVYEEFTKLP